MTPAPELKIRKVETNEYRTCARIYASAWNKALPDVQREIGVDDFKNEIAGELTLAATLDNQIVGFISIWEPDWFIHHLYVEPSKHRSGVGRSLIVHVERLAGERPLSLKCQTANRGAIGFYTAIGFDDALENGVDEYGSWVRLVKTRERDNIR